LWDFQTLRFGYNSYTQRHGGSHHMSTLIEDPEAEAKVGVEEAEGERIGVSVW
jgi:hypothetical protein